MKKLFLESAPFAIRCLWVCLIIAPTTWVVFSSLKTVVPFSSADFAAWIQAIGSIAAIIGAVWVSRAQTQRDEQRRRIDETEEYVKLAGFTSYVIGAMQETISHLEHESPEFQDVERHLWLLEECGDVLKSVSFHSIKGVILATKWVQLRQVLIDFIREGRLEKNVEMIRMFRLPFMRRSLQRAINIQSEIFTERFEVSLDDSSVKR